MFQSQQPIDAHTLESVLEQIVSREHTSPGFAAPLEIELDRLDRLPMALAIDRQPHCHLRAGAKPTPDAHVAAVQAHQAFDDRQAKAGAVMPPVVRCAGLEEGFTEPCQIGLADADAGVLADVALEAVGDLDFEVQRPDALEQFLRLRIRRVDDRHNLQQLVEGDRDRGGFH